MASLISLDQQTLQQFVLVVQNYLTSDYTQMKTQIRLAQEELANQSIKKLVETCNILKSVTNELRIAQSDLLREMQSFRKEVKGSMEELRQELIGTKEDLGPRILQLQNVTREIKAHINSETSKQGSKLQELDSVKKVLGDELQGFGQQIQQVRQELLGNSNNSDNKESVMETTSVRQILEKIEYDVQDTKRRIIEEDSQKAREKPELLELFSHYQNCKASINSSSGSNEDEDFRAGQSKEISRKTEQDYRVWLKEEFTALKPTVPLSLDEDAFASAGTNLAIQITNLLDVPLDLPSFWSPDTSLSCRSLDAIPKATDKIVTFHDARITGLLTFTVSNPTARGGDVKLAIFCSTPLNMFAISLIPEDMAIEKDYRELFGRLSRERESYREDAKLMQLDKLGGEIIVQYGGVRAKASLALKKVSVAILSAREELFGNGEAHPRPDFNSTGPCTQTDIERKSLEYHPKSYLRLALRLTFAREKYACVVEIRNCLSVRLEKPVIFGPDPLEETLLTYIKPFSKESFLFQNSKKATSVLSYRIRGTDIRLAVAFRVEPDGNAYGIGLLPTKTETDKDLLDSLLSRTEWRFRNDRRFAFGKDGVQTIYVRNIKVEASMSNDSKALLQVKIVTF